MQQWAPNSLQFLDPHNIDEMHVYASQCKIPSYPADSGQEIQSLQYKAVVITFLVVEQRPIVKCVLYFFNGRQETLASHHEQYTIFCDII